MANTINQQGVNLSNMTGTNAGQLAGILAGTGENQSISQQQLATLLGGLSQAQIAAVAGAASVGQDSNGAQNLMDYANFAKGMMPKDKPAQGG